MKLVRSIGNHGKTFEQSDLCLKIYSNLPQEYEKVSLPIREGSEWGTMTIEQYFGKLEAYELEGMIKIQPAPSTSQSLALTAQEKNSKTITQQDIDTMIQNALQNINITPKPTPKPVLQEDIPSLITMAVRNAMKYQKKAFERKFTPNFNPSSSNSNQEGQAVKRRVECYNCGKPDHYAAECTEPKKQREFKRKLLKRNHSQFPDAIALIAIRIKVRKNKEQVMIADSSRFSDDELVASDSDSDDEAFICMIAEEENESEDEEDMEALAAAEELQEVQNFNSLNIEGFKSLVCTLLVKTKRHENKLCCFDF